MHNPDHFCGRPGTSGARHAGAEGGAESKGLEVSPGWPERGTLASPATCASDANADPRGAGGGGRCGVGVGEAAESPSGSARVRQRLSGDGCRATPRGGRGGRPAAGPQRLGKPRRIGAAG